MSIPQSIRVGGIALLVGGVLGLIGSLAAPITPDPQQAVSNTLFLPAALLSVLGVLLVIVGLPAAYARIAVQAGWVGLVGFATLLLTAVMLGFFPSALALLIVPWLAAQSIPLASLAQGPALLNTYFMLGGIVSLVGAVLFGIAAIRSQVLSRWAGYLLILAGIVSIVASFLPSLPGVLQNVPPALFYIALGWFGYELSRESSQVVAFPTEERPGVRAA